MARFTLQASKTVFWLLRRDNFVCTRVKTSRCTSCARAGLLLRIARVLSLESCLVVTWVFYPSFFSWFLFSSSFRSLLSPHLLFSSPQEKGQLMLIWRKIKTTEKDNQVQNLYDQVDDFKWLKAEQSPNWRVMDPQTRVKDEIWKDIVPGNPQNGVGDILKAVGIWWWWWWLDTTVLWGLSILSDRCIEMRWAFCTSSASSFFLPSSPLLNPFLLCNFILFSNSYQCPCYRVETFFSCRPLTLSHSGINTVLSFP